MIVGTSRPERAEHGGPGGAPGGRGDDLVVDIDRVLPVVILLGVIGVILLSLVAWWAARRSVRPLGEALRRQRHFVADASHELRTPLTTVTSRIQVVQRRYQRGERIDDGFVELRRDAAAMSDVLGDMLLAAEAGAPGAAASCSAAAAVGEAVRSVQVLADDASVQLDMDAHDAEVRIPLVTLTRAVVILLDNAIQHAPAGSSVTVDVRTDRGFCVIRVTYRGSGITGVPVDRVFDRFVRSRESGRRRRFGLGLSLAQDIAVQAGGSLQIEQTSPSGTTFALRVPVAG